MATPSGCVPDPEYNVSHPNHGYLVLSNLSDKVINGLSREPKYLAQTLFGKGFLSQEKLNEIHQIPATDNDNAYKIYSAVLCHVQHFPQKYTDFISVFQSNNILYDDLLHALRKEVHKIETENNRVEVCSCPKRIKCDIDVEVSLNLTQTVRKLEKEFKSLTRKAYKLLKMLKLELDDFFAEVSSMDVSLKSVAAGYFEKCFRKAKQDGSFAVLWGDLNHFWDFFNFELFQHIVEVTITDSDHPIHCEISEYAKEVNSFSSRTKVHEFLEVWPFSKEKPLEKDIIEMQRVVVTVEIDWKQCTLLDIKHVSLILAQTFFLPREFFLVSGAGEGSLRILWYIPIVLASSIEVTMTEDIEKTLLEQNFLSIAVDDVQIFPLSAIKRCSLHMQQIYECKFTYLDFVKPSFKAVITPFKLALIEKLQVWTTIDTYTMTTIRGNSDDVRYRKSPLMLEDIGYTSDGSSARLVLIEGAPGVGKTTFCRQACLKWKKKLLFTNIPLLYLLPLRDYNLKNVSTLTELLAFVNTHDKSLIREAEKCEGEGICFFFDGWDEIASSLDGHSSIYERLVSGEVLPKAKVIVTSRPWATDFIKGQLDKQPSQHIEIVSSVQDQIDRLKEIQSQAPTSKEPSVFEIVLKNIDIFPSIRDHMHTPLATHITLAVYHWCQETSSPLPTTVTELYTLYTCFCVHKYLNKDPHFSSKLWKSNDFKDLPGPLQTSFKGLCSLAFDGLLDGQRLVFPDVPSNLRLKTLELMEAQVPLYSSEESAVVSYHYNHLTLQEFLSALLLSWMSEEERYKTIEGCISDGQFIMVLRFFTGLTKSLPVSNDEVIRRMLVSDKDKLTVFHWLFEGGINSASIIGKDGMRVKAHYSWSALDYFVSGHCIAQSNCQWDIDFGAAYVGDEKMTQFLHAVSKMSAKEQGNAFIATLDLSNNELSHGLSHLPDIPPVFFRHLKSLDLSWNNLDGIAMYHIAKAVAHMPQLNVINLRWNKNIQQGGAIPLVSALGDHQALKDFNLTSTNIGIDDCKELARLLSSTPTLKMLNVSDNSLSPSSTKVLFMGLQHNNTLTHADIHGNHLSMRAMTVLSAYLRDEQHCKLVSLDLRYCNISPDIAAEFARGLGPNSSLKLLRLSYNPIGDEGAVALGHAIAVNKKLTKISLVDCGISIIGGAALASCLMINKTMDKLYINTNSIGTAIRDFAFVLQHNKKLKILDIRNDDSFGQYDINFLLSSLAHNQTIEELRLPIKFQVDTDKRVQWQ